MCLVMFDMLIRFYYLNVYHESISKNTFDVQNDDTE